MKNKAKILEYLEIVAPILPAPIYWLDKNSKALGINQAMMEAIGSPSNDFCNGKSAYDVYPFELAQKIVNHNNEVMKVGETLLQEEVIKDITTGKIKTFTAIKAPLYDDDGEIIGTIGTSIDITAQKAAEKFALESKTKQIQAELEAYKKFKQIADQMAHDLGSPLMALSVLENSCAELPEAKRSMLKESISRIRDIAGSILSQYQPLEENNTEDKLNSKELLVYAAVEQIIMDKQYEYHDLDIEFESYYTKDSKFSFIKSDATLFKRMLSNIINNSVDAIENKPGKITIKLDSNNEEIKISITDNGKGMSESTISKIMNKIPVSSGKVNGYGIGFSQIHETLEHLSGNISIHSTINTDTTIILAFPKIQTPEWLAEQIEVNSTDTVIILDDDNSIHGAWDIRFANILKSVPSIKLEHFKYGEDMVNYINNLSSIEKQKIFLLTDYELLKQNLNGLDVIEKTNINRSILVTSHYNNSKIRQQASYNNTKILPKILASEVDIIVE